MIPTINVQQDPEFISLAEIPSKLHVEEAPAALHIEQDDSIQLQLEIETEYGIRYVIDLGKGLNDQQKGRLTDLLNGNSRNLMEEMNPTTGKPSAEALELQNLVQIALGGHPLSFAKGDKVFVTEGSFLKNYQVDNAFRERIIAKIPATEQGRKELVLKQYDCAFSLLKFTQEMLQKQLQQINEELVTGGPQGIKSELEMRRRQLEKQLDFYDSSKPHSIRQNAILTAASFEPLNLINKTNDEQRKAVRERTAEIKASLDEHVERGTLDFFGKDNPNYEPRNEREGLIPFIPIGCSNTSTHDQAKAKFAHDIALETAGMPQVPSAESFFIEIARLTAQGADDVTIKDAITGPHSNFCNALGFVHEKDRNAMQNDFVKAAKALKQIASNIPPQSSSNNEELCYDVDTAFAARVTAESALNP